VGPAGAAHLEEVGGVDDHGVSSLQTDIYHMARDVRQEQALREDDHVFGEFEAFLAQPGVDCIDMAEDLVRRKITDPKLRRQMLEQVAERRRQEDAKKDANNSAAAVGLLGNACTNLLWGRKPCPRVADPALDGICRKCHKNIQRYVRLQRSEEEREAEREAEKERMLKDRLAYVQKLHRHSTQRAGKKQHPLLGAPRRHRTRREVLSRQQQPLSSRPTRVEEPEDVVVNGMQQMVLHQETVKASCLECGAPVVLTPEWPRCPQCSAIVCGQKCADKHSSGNHGPCVWCSRTTPQHDRTVCTQCGELLCFPCQGQGLTCPHNQSIVVTPQHSVVHHPVAGAEPMDVDEDVDILH
jgi:hypothetical protein